MAALIKAACLKTLAAGDSFVVTSAMGVRRISIRNDRDSPVTGIVTIASDAKVGNVAAGSVVLKAGDAFDDEADAGYCIAGYTITAATGATAYIYLW